MLNSVVSYFSLVALILMGLFVILCAKHKLFAVLPGLIIYLLYGELSVHAAVMCTFILSFVDGLLGALRQEYSSEPS